LANNSHSSSPDNQLRLRSKHHNPERLTNLADRVNNVVAADSSAGLI
jgi:hypothetical protein